MHGIYLWYVRFILAVNLLCVLKKKLDYLIILFGISYRGIVQRIAFSELNRLFSPTYPHFTAYIAYSPNCFPYFTAYCFFVSSTSLYYFLAILKCLITIPASTTNR